MLVVAAVRVTVAGVVAHVFVLVILKAGVVRDYVEIRPGARSSNRGG